MRYESIRRLWSWCRTLGLSNDRSLVPLRICQDRNTSQAPQADGLQLFNLPPLWDALGLLQGEERSNPRRARLDGIVSLGRSLYPLRSMSTVRLCNALGTSQESGRRSGRH
jgi:hypothetical protein